MHSVMPSFTQTIDQATGKVCVNQKLHAPCPVIIAPSTANHLHTLNLTEASGIRNGSQ